MPCSVWPSCPAAGAWSRWVRGLSLSSRGMSYGSDAGVEFWSAVVVRVRRDCGDVRPAAWAVSRRFTWWVEMDEVDGAGVGLVATVHDRVLARVGRVARVGERGVLERRDLHSQHVGVVLQPLQPSLHDQEGC